MNSKPSIVSRKTSTQSTIIHVNMFLWLCLKSLTVHYIVSLPFCSFIPWTHHIPQCIEKSSAQPVVTNQALYTIMHCAERKNSRRMGREHIHGGEH